MAHRERGAGDCRTGAVVLLVLCSLAAGTAVQGQDTQGTHAFSGRVVDEQGQGIGNVLVRLYWYSGDEFASHEARAADDGTYRFDLPSADRLALFLIPATDAFPRRQLSIDDGIAADLEYEAVLAPAFQISGTVSDEGGSPVPGITLRVNDFTRMYEDSDRSGADGSYALQMPAGTYDLDVRFYSQDGPSLSPAHYTITVDGDMQFNLVLPAGFQVTIEVVDEDGTPVLDADVHADGADDVWNGGSTDNDGRALMSLHPGRYEIRLNRPPLPLLPMDTTVDVHSDTTIRLVLQPGVAISGSLTHSDGREVDGWGPLNFEGLNGARSFWGHHTSGEYEIALPPGRYRVYPAIGAGLYPSQDVGTIEVAEESTVFDFVIQKGQVVDVLITDASGHPVAGVGVSAATMDGRWASSSEESGASGQLQLGLFPGRYRLLASLQGSRSRAEVGEIEVPAAGPVAVVLPDGSSLTGHISSPSLSLAHHVYAYRSVHDIKVVRGYDYVACTSRVDASGAYELIVRPGTYQILATKTMADYTEVGRLFVDVALDGHVKRDVHLPDDSQCVQLRGRVVTKGLTPRPVLRLQFWDRDTSIMAFGHSSDPEFYQVSLPPGRYHVRAALIGWQATGSDLFDLGDLTLDEDTEWDIHLSPAVTAVEGPRQPHRFALSQSYPNPFNSQTVIRFALSERRELDLGVYNVVGQRVATLASGWHPAGIHVMHWDGHDDRGRALASGVYLYRLAAGNHCRQTRRMLLLRRAPHIRRCATGSNCAPSQLDGVTRQKASMPQKRPKATTPRCRSSVAASSACSTVRLTSTRSAPASA